LVLDLSLTYSLEEKGHPRVALQSSTRKEILNPYFLNFTM
jgi:hypothetical protein